LKIAIQILNSASLATDLSVQEGGYSAVIGEEHNTHYQNYQTCLNTPASSERASNGMRAKPDSLESSRSSLEKALASTGVAEDKAAAVTQEEDIVPRGVDISQVGIIKGLFPRGSSNKSVIQVQEERHSGLADEDSIYSDHIEERNSVTSSAIVKK
jgi:hypothetical protein